MLFGINYFLSFLRITNDFDKSSSDSDIVASDASDKEMNSESDHEERNSYNTKAVIGSDDDIDEQSDTNERNIQSSNSDNDDDDTGPKTKRKARIISS